MLHRAHWKSNGIIWEEWIRVREGKAWLVDFLGMGVENFKIRINILWTKTNKFEESNWRWNRTSTKSRLS